MRNPSDQHGVGLDPDPARSAKLLRVFARFNHRRTEKQLMAELVLLARYPASTQESAHRWARVGACFGRLDSLKATSFHADTLRLIDGMPPTVGFPLAAILDLIGQCDGLSPAARFRSRALRDLVAASGERWLAADENGGLGLPSREPALWVQ